MGKHVLTVTFLLLYTFSTSRCYKQILYKNKTIFIVTNAKENKRKQQQQQQGQYYLSVLVLQSQL